MSHDHAYSKSQVQCSHSILNNAIPSYWILPILGSIDHDSQANSQNLEEQKCQNFIHSSKCDPVLHQERLIQSYQPAHSPQHSTQWACTRCTLFYTYINHCLWLPKRIQRLSLSHLCWWELVYLYLPEESVWALRASKTGHLSNLIIPVFQYSQMRFNSSFSETICNIATKPKGVFITCSPGSIRDRVNTFRHTKGNYHMNKTDYFFH